MRDRVTELGGLLTVESAPGDGTRVRAWFPLRPVGSNGASRAVEGVTEEAR